MPIGHKHSEETKEKMRTKKIGVKMSEKFRKRQSEIMKKDWANGRKKAVEYHSEISKEKNRIAHLGRKPTMETRLKMKKSMMGKNSKGYITPLNKMIRTSFEYKFWRKSVFQRDNFMCQKYKISGGILQAHHINNFADYPELRFAIDNGITLSEKAHKEFHKLYGKKNNTKEQLNEFLK